MFVIKNIRQQAAEQLYKVSIGAATPMLQITDDQIHVILVVHSFVCKSRSDIVRNPLATHAADRLHLGISTADDSQPQSALALSLKPLYHGIYS